MLPDRHTHDTSDTAGGMTPRGDSRRLDAKEAVSVSARHSGSWRPIHCLVCLSVCPWRAPSDTHCLVSVKIDRSSCSVAASLWVANTTGRYKVQR